MASKHLRIQCSKKGALLQVQVLNGVAQRQNEEHPTKNDKKSELRDYKE